MYNIYRVSGFDYDMLLQLVKYLYRFDIVNNDWLSNEAVLPVLSSVLLSDMFAGVLVDAYRNNLFDEGIEVVDNESLTDLWKLINAKVAVAE